MRRVFTDGRPWPENEVTSYQGISIGKWIDEDGDGRYDVLEVETRGPFRNFEVDCEWQAVPGLGLFGDHVLAPRR